jgi:hypothetical protein
VRPKRFPTIPLLVALTGGFLLLPAGNAISEELKDIRVINFPESQKVRGTVSVEGPVSSAELRRFSEASVPQVPPEATTRLVHAGVLEAEGYTRVLLSLVGQLRGAQRQPGAIGVLLVPAEQPVREAFVDHGTVLIPLRLEVPVEAGSPRFVAAQGTRENLAFPRYDVFLYNTTSSVATVDLYALVSNG